MVLQLRKRSPLLGMIVPLALLAGQLSTIVHSMLVEHERCREHGEMVHRALARGDDDAALPATKASLLAGTDRRGDLGTHLAPDAEAADRHRHEHCLSLTGRRDGLRAPEPPVATTFAPPALTLSAPTTRAVLASAGLLRMAPKTSPPRTTVTA